MRASDRGRPENQKTRKSLAKNRTFTDISTRRRSPLRRGVYLVKHFRGPIPIKERCDSSCVFSSSHSFSLCILFRPDFFQLVQNFWQVSQRINANRSAACARSESCTTEKQTGSTGSPCLAQYSRSLWSGFNHITGSLSQRSDSQCGLFRGPEGEGADVVISKTLALRLSEIISLLILWTPHINLFVTPSTR